MPDRSNWTPEQREAERQAVKRLALDPEWRKRRSERAARWRKMNPEKSKQNGINSHNRNKAKRLAKAAEWKRKNRPKIREYMRKYMAQNPQAVMRSRLCARIHKVLKSVGSKKEYKTWKLLGVSYPEFMAHIEGQFKPGMAWNNRHLWHIDHIIPCAAFDLTDPKQQRKCFHYTNLQPLWAHENQSKSSKIIAPKE